MRELDHLRDTPSRSSMTFERVGKHPAERLPSKSLCPAGSFHKGLVVDHQTSPAGLATGMTFFQCISTPKPLPAVHICPKPEKIKKHLSQWGLHQLGTSCRKTTLWKTNDNNNRPTVHFLVWLASALHLENGRRFCSGLVARIGHLAFRLHRRNGSS